MRKRIRWGAAALIGGGLLMPLSSSATAAEFGDKTSYYEDDAWYDVTEWLDGNDYNPTDEAWWRWDDETYQARQDASGDRDSDWNYGYNAGNGDDWFYDRYYYPGMVTYQPYGQTAGDDTPATGSDAGQRGASSNGKSGASNPSGANAKAGDANKADASSGGATNKSADAGARPHKTSAGQSADQSNSGWAASSVYYDIDTDGFYDAYSFVSDTNGDGTVDERRFYYFSDAGKTGANQNQQQGQQQAAGSRPLTGKIDKIKQVDVRGTKHTVVSITPQQQQSGQKQGADGQAQQGQQQGQPAVADLGKSDALQALNLKQGDQITVRGPMSKVGDKQVIMARSLKAAGQTKQIDRQGRQMTGKVLNTHRAKVRGTEHLLAMVELQRSGQQQAQAGQKQADAKQSKPAQVVVDLGPAEQIQSDVTKGTNLTFTGVPVKVKDKRLILAQSLKQGERIVQIDRQAGQTGEAVPASAKEKADPSAQQQQPQQQQDSGQKQQ